MRVYGLKLQRVCPNEDIYRSLQLISKKLDIVGPREFTVINQYDHNRVTHCLTWHNIVKADERKKFYVKDAYLEKIKTVFESDLTRQKILELTEKPRSIFVIRDGSNPKKLSFGDIIAEIPVYYIVDMLSETRHPADCPYLHKFEIKE
jgi:hypothetical protein